MDIQQPYMRRDEMSFMGSTVQYASIFLKDSVTNLEWVIKGIYKTRIVGTGEKCWFGRWLDSELMHVHDCGQVGGTWSTRNGGGGWAYGPVFKGVLQASGRSEAGAKELALLDEGFAGREISEKVGDQREDMISCYRFDGAYFRTAHKQGCDEGRSVLFPLLDMTTARWLGPASGPAWKGVYRRAGWKDPMIDRNVLPTY